MRLSKILFIVTLAVLVAAAVALPDGDAFLAAVDMACVTGLLAVMAWPAERIIATMADPWLDLEDAGDTQVGDNGAVVAALQEREARDAGFDGLGRFGGGRFQ